VLEQITRRMSDDISRRALIGGMAASIAALSARLARAQARRVPEAPDAPILFTNLRLFDGKSDALRAGLRVRVDRTRIAAVEAANAPVAPGVRTIDCGGRVLMPGLIDAHWHTMFAAITLPTALTADIGYIYLVASAEAERTLMRGFTTVRDCGGPSFALKRAIDEGLVSGPRIFPSGAMIAQTSGHGDFRSRYEVPRTGASPLSRGEQVGAAAIADGVDEVLRRTREQLMAGASQIKLTAGGGVASPFSPIDATAFSPDEIRAAVLAAEDWGTYVMAHAYTSRAVQRAIGAGVKCIEHGHLVDEDTARMIADRGVWWSLQVFLDDVDAFVLPDAERQQMMRAVQAGTDTAYDLAKRHRAKLAWGTDMILNPGLTARQAAQLPKLARWFTPVQALKMATSDNADLLALSGPRNPYDGKLGVIEPGAFADLLVVDGDPTSDLRVFDDSDRTIRIIMKDGRVYKDTASQ
jgi:imidazolonepropionase-like amidohydrolase